MPSAARLLLRADGDTSGGLGGDRKVKCLRDTCRRLVTGEDPGGIIDVASTSTSAIPTLKIVSPSVRQLGSLLVQTMLAIVTTGAVLDRIFIFVVSSPSIYGRCLFRCNN